MTLTFNVNAKSITEINEELTAKNWTLNACLINIVKYPSFIYRLII